MSYVLAFLAGMAYAFGIVLLGRSLAERAPKPQKPSDAYDEALCREWRIRL